MKWPALIKKLGFEKAGEINLILNKSRKLAFLEISHPSRNCMTSTMQLEFREKLETVQRESTDLHGLVLYGDRRNKAFCAGADLNEVKAMAEYFKDSDEKTLPMFEYMQESCDIFRSLLVRL